MRLAADPHTMTPERYDAWYDTPRGRWIGGVEWPLLRSALELRAGDSVLDVGCGTGWFTRRVAAEGPRAVGLDLDEGTLEFARRHGPERQLPLADATSLPFGDRSFDKLMSVTALCFVQQWPEAVAETEPAWQTATLAKRVPTGRGLRRTSLAGLRGCAAARSARAR